MGGVGQSGPLVWKRPGKDNFLWERWEESEHSFGLPAWCGPPRCAWMSLGGAGQVSAPGGVEHGGPS